MKQMSITGIGTKLVVITIGYAIPVALCQKYFSIDFTIRLLPHPALTIAGITLLAIGILGLLFSFIAIKKAYQKDALCTTGIYAICRHPIYASWILYITPASCFY
ncbi:isoprenylcysteine carboxylmethyltransferase family protein [Microbacter margulisiae]|uniref:Protein-S-isoprenylcysteine O-methyltransferase Ste14 n=1 Tax=Microbacter margulisiae TaxID=1350067 RepID=A0A7W5DQZ0_9PORP|nr:isoprenylcysteine carboxylmethyltransferase family protein [Microbacter margulisiae]MBB3187406.1 protein-S-isoprenylcysteine O-methyltransferase Ste14 [Microbacter margulisiae]